MRRAVLDLSKLWPHELKLWLAGLCLDCKGKREKEQSKYCDHCLAERREQAKNRYHAKGPYGRDHED